MGIVEITNSVVMLENEFGANIICFALDKEIVFIDTGLHTEIASDFRKKMEGRFNRKATSLIITHGHIDHLFGIGAFKGLKVIAAEASKQKFERFVQANYTEEVITNFSRVFPHFRESVEFAKLFMPDIWIEKEFTIGGNREIVFQVVGGHSNCSSIIHFQPEEVLVVGDLVQVDVYPYFGEQDTDMVKWINNLKSWANQNITHFLPGHGKPIDKVYLRNVQKFFENLISTLKQLKKENLPIEQVLHHPLLPSGYWPTTAIRKPAYDYSISNLYNKL